MPAKITNFHKPQNDTGLLEEQLILSVLLFGQFHYREIEPKLEDILFDIKEHKAIYRWIIEQNEDIPEIATLPYYLISNYGYTNDYCNNLIASLLCTFNEINQSPSLEFINNITNVLSKKRKGSVFLTETTQSINKQSAIDSDKISSCIKKIHHEAGVLLESWGPTEKFFYNGEEMDVLLDEWYESYKKEVIKTPFHKLNQLTNGGFRPGDLIVIGARTNIGKTTFASNLCLHFALHELQKKEQIFFWTLEDKPAQIANKMLNMILKDNVLKPSNPNTTANLRAARNQLKKLNIIYSLSRISIEEFCNRIKQIHLRLFCRVIIIDYANKLSSEKNHNSRTEAVASISSKLRELASSCNITIILLAQINRNSESRSSRIPQLFDLKESGSLEESADIVLLLHREYPYLITNPVHPKEHKKYQEYLDELTREKNKAKLFVAKNKLGITDSIELYIYGEDIGFTENQKI